MTSKHSRFCDLVAMGHAGYIALICEDGTPIRAEAPPLVPLAENLRRHALVKGCAWRTERTDCGCAGLATCVLSKGKDGLVNLADCLACVSDRD